MCQPRGRRLHASGHSARIKVSIGTLGFPLTRLLPGSAKRRVRIGSNEDGAPSVAAAPILTNFVQDLIS
jgi:hypothetical protein